MTDMLKDLRAALCRLEKSDTPRKRKNARLMFKRAMKEFEERADSDFRPMRMDGTIITKKAKARGVQCPICKAPLLNIGHFIQHAVAAHYKLSGCECVCGKKFTMRGLKAHLMKHNLVLHFGAAAIAEAAK